MTVNVSPGYANIEGAIAYEEYTRTMNIEASNSLDRIDRIVLRLNDNLEARKIDLYVIKGTPAQTPLAPAITRNDSVYELSLATVYINANSTNITQSKITDTRLSSSVCGIVAQAVNGIDTTTLYNQIQADLQEFKKDEEANFVIWSNERELSFDEWFETIKGKLSGDIAGSLQLQIDEIKMTCPFPVGFVLTSGKADFDPNKEYYATSWERIKGRVIVGVDENDSDFNVVDKTGGAKSFNNQHSHSIAHTHTINGHTHTTGSLALTTLQMPEHYHEVTVVSDQGNSFGASGGNVVVGPRGTNVANKQRVESSGSGQAHNHGPTASSGTLTTNASSASNSGANGNAQQSILQPYITKYIWERTA